MGSRENFSIFISNRGGNYAVELQNGEIREFFLQRRNNFLGKYFALRGINCIQVLPNRGNIPPLWDSAPPLLAPFAALRRLTGPPVAASQPSGNARWRNTS